MPLPPTTIINQEICNGCGLCVKVCPDKTLSMLDGKAVVTGDKSFYCDHCAAICPTQAITVGALDKEALEFSTLENRNAWLKYGNYDTAGLVQLMRSRRSSRMFMDRPVPREILEDLIKIGISAPSGTNSQLWTFTIVADRAGVMKIGDATASFFRKLNKLAEKWAARLISKVFMKDVLGEYYREYYESVKVGLKEFDETGVDRLFHGAPALIIIGMQPGASCPCEDALLASQNILLAAHSMGYGTCLVGFLVEAMKNDPKIKKLVGIPKEETVYAAIAIGRTKEIYKRLANRKKVTPRYFAG
ncbi:MAG: nitroreductase family protein [Deltaproteobacteria bacterium]|nr:nitroreductase family protein [Deltaproteobacteria bacterium]MBW1871230.1 nitroreductase family protein [Deltaproteobacteria bacterium]